MSVREELLRLLFPPKCAFCHTLLDAGEEGVCRKCRASLPFLGDVCRGKAEFVEEVAAALYYRGDVPEAVHRFKFAGRRFYADTFAPMMAEAVRRQLSDGYDCVSWVPVSRRRYRQRGYDQAQELAVRLAALLGLPCVKTLEKIRHNPAQSATEGDAARRANVTGCYRVCDGAAAEGKRILLTDDVLTSGSTVAECARMLRMAGAENVGAAVLALAQKQKA